MGFINLICYIMIFIFIQKDDNKAQKDSSSFCCFLIEFYILLFFFFFYRHLLEQHFHCHRDQVMTKSFPCAAVENCLFSGRSAAELRNHLLSHSNEKTFHCSFVGCNYKGKSIYLLKRWVH